MSDEYAVEGPFWDPNAGDEYTCTGKDNEGVEIRVMRHTRREAIKAFKQSKDFSNQTWSAWDKGMAKLGFDRCDTFRWIYDGGQPGSARLFGLTIFVAVVDSKATLNLKFEAAINIDTEHSQEDLAAYEQLNCEFDSPVEAAQFAIDELKEGLMTALKELPND